MNVLPGPARIEDHGIIGNLQTIALVSTGGTVDFACFPRFDSATIFASLLDAEHGGAFSLHPVEGCLSRTQLYLPETNVLLTRFFTREGVAEIRDFMPVARTGDTQHFCIVRSVRVIRGSVRMHLRCAPRFNYARTPHQIELTGELATFRPTDGSATLRLDAPVPLRVEGGDAVGEFTVHLGEVLSVALEAADAPSVKRDQDASDLALGRTIAFWRDWSQRSTYAGRWREPVMRSALTLKLLMSHEFGSLVAAPTFGLPEQIGGGRNWDYRYCWIRDAALTVYAFMRLGYKEEVKHFLSWIQERCHTCGTDGALQLMYGIDGRSDLDEEVLPQFEGFGHSTPVRIGNDASKQLQLDIYGPLMDAVYLANKWGVPTSVDSWQSLVKVVDYVCSHYAKPDAGIWEIRGKPRHYLHSRLMCWVAVDRAYRLAMKRSLPAPLARWAEVRDKIHQSILNDFWDEDSECFVRSKDEKKLDAALLMMPLMRFISPTDPRWLSTLKRIGELLMEEPDVYRYRIEGEHTDGLAGAEGAFVACSFWYVEALCRADQLDDAQLIFERLLDNGNHLGLYSEERSLDNLQTGNFPQALTHLALISAAFCMDRKLSAERPAAWS